MASWNNGLDNTAYGGTFIHFPGSAAIVADTEWAITGRGEWLAMGTWDQFKDITSPQGEEMGIRVGAAFHFQRNESGAGLPPSDELLILTGDVSVEFGGANVYAQINHGNMNYKTVGGGPNLDGTSTKPWGIVLGGGYYFTEDWEVFGRYEWSDQSNLTPALAGGGRADNLSIFTVGVNKYFSGHNAKWTTDVGIGLTQVNLFGAGTAGASMAPVTGYRSDIPDEDGQIVIRTQLQILF